MRRVAALCLAVAAAGGALAFGGADGPRVVVRDEAGDIVVAVGLPADGRFALAYRHSVYGAPAQERFRSLRGDRFALDGVASRSRRVLDYYELAGRERRAGRWLVLTPRRPTCTRSSPLPRPSAAAARCSSPA